MRTLLLAVLLPAALSAQTFDAGLARQLSAQVKAVKSSPAVARRIRSGYVNGSGTISGSGVVTCSPYGTMSGYAHLTGTISVSGDGVHGSIPVSAEVALSGSCSNGSGSVSGGAGVSGSGSVYDEKGEYAGSAHVSGTGFVSAYGSSSVFLTTYVSVSGSF